MNIFFPQTTPEKGVPATIEVYSGFYVNEADVELKQDVYDVSKKRVGV